MLLLMLKVIVETALINISCQQLTKPSIAFTKTPAGVGKLSLAYIIQHIFRYLFINIIFNRFYFFQ